ncbi:hypothetical protein NEF87_005088 [Candidatus Lokiarchaeum ossiferum]|uniref:Uncharacterized protein n=1 Tax=Candidatus Lokiarchaeum ossiferum TaxID=2951803 RepID=A0ABY6HZ51_9ARCH|nr:hypothetical protein NEF87_005088 [Candidatus Lokiarchaeum sp. B-35]
MEQYNHLLQHVCWGFSTEEYTFDEFQVEIELYNRDVDPKHPWNPDQIVFPYREIVLEAPQGDEFLSIHSLRPDGFSALVLMYDVHHWYREYFHLDPHHYFFEGLSRIKKPTSIPSFFILTGS